MALRRRKRKTEPEYFIVPAARAMSDEIFMKHFNARHRRADMPAYVIDVPYNRMSEYGYFKPDELIVVTPGRIDIRNNKLITNTPVGLCEHCNMVLEPGKMRSRADQPAKKAKDDKRFCGFCKVNYACCASGLHGEVGMRV